MKVSRSPSSYQFFIFHLFQVYNNQGYDGAHPPHAQHPPVPHHPKVQYIILAVHFEIVAISKMYSRYFFYYYYRDLMGS